jgi:hypothetical protein
MVIGKMVRGGILLKKPRTAGILLILTIMSSFVRVWADPTTATTPFLGGILAHDPDLMHNWSPLELTNNSTVTVHLLGSEGHFDAIHLSETPDFTGEIQSYWMGPLGDLDDPSSVSFTLSPGDATKTIWALIDNGEEFSFPLTSYSLTLDRAPPDLTDTKLSKPDNDRLRFKIHFDENVHDFTAEDIWFQGTAERVENFTGQEKDFEFDVIVNDSGQLMVGIMPEEVFDLAGNSVVEQASPLLEYDPLSEPEGGATESNTLMSGFFSPFSGLPAGMMSLTSLAAPGGGEENGGTIMALTASGGADPVWVDFLWDGPYLGTEEEPFRTLADGLAAVTPGGAVILDPASSAETPRITQAVRLESTGGPVRIGDPLQFQTQYIQFDWGLPLNTPNNAVIAQVQRGTSAEVKQLEVASVTLVDNGNPSAGSTDWFQLVPLQDGNYSLVWNPSIPPQLSTYEQIEVAIDRIEQGTPTLDRTLTFDLTDDNDTVKWCRIQFGSNVDVWAMVIPPYFFVAPEQSSTSYFYAFVVGESYPIEVRKKTRLHTPPPNPYLGWTAFATNLTAPIDGWQANPSYWVHDPANILGPERDMGNVVGGKATMYIDDLKTEPEFGDSLLLVEQTQSASAEVLQDKMFVRTPGLNKMIEAGLDNSVAELVIEQTSDIFPVIGQARVLNATNPNSLQLVLDMGQDRATLPISAIGGDDVLPFVVEGADRGFGSVTVSLHHKAEGPDDHVHTDLVNHFTFAVTLALEDVNSTLDANPNWGAGKRIFPDRQTPTDATSRDELLVRVTLDPPLSGVPVRLRVLDVDDATATSFDPSGVIDVNAANGNDNFGVAGTLSAPGGLTSSGVYTSQMTVGMQPGDNYRVAFAFKQEMIDQLTVDNVGASKQVPADNNQKIGYNGLLSEMLTVWRRLWYEFDSMGPIPTSGPEKNFDDGVIAGIQTGVPAAGQSTIDTGRFLTDEEDRFEGGRIEIDGFPTPYEVIGNTDNALFDDEVVIDGTPGSGAVGKSFKLYDDDTTVFPHALVEDWLLESAMKDAYIKPFNVGPSYVDNNTPFNRNIDSATEMTNIAQVNKDLSNNLDFWVVYLLAACQDAVSEDLDPDPEGGGSGKTTFGLARDDLNLGMIYLEDIREVEEAANVPSGTLEENVIAHEIGHQGSGGDEIHAHGELMSSNPDFATATKYDPKTIVLFRKESDF